LNGDRYSGVAVARRFALTLRNDKRRRNPQSLSKKYGDVIATDQSLVATLERRDSKALDQLIPLVHGELRRMARRYMGQQPAGPHTPDDSADPRGLCALVGREETDGRTATILWRRTQAALDLNAVFKTQGFPV